MHVLPQQSPATVSLLLLGILDTRCTAYIHHALPWIPSSYVKFRLVGATLSRIYDTVLVLMGNLLLILDVYVLPYNTFSFVCYIQYSRRHASHGVMSQ